MKAQVLSHLGFDDRAAIGEYIAAIQNRFPDRILAVILFGSKARGDAGAESDIDLLVLVDIEGIYDGQPNVVRAELWRVASDISLEHNVVISPRVFDQTRWAEVKRINLPLYRAILADGISLIPERAAI